MKNFGLGLAVALIVVGLVTGAYYFGSLSKTKTSESTVVASSAPSASPTEQLVGGDRDEHGCIPSAGYQWCEAKQKCLRSWEEKCVAENDAAAIGEALYKKNGWSRSMIIVVDLSYNDGKYAKGSVTEKDSTVGGGYVFAEKVNGSWEIVADGNGVITCEAVNKYPDFPNSLIGECYDQSINKVVKR